MDPIAAFGLAVNILTVVDLSLKVISNATEIRKFGDTVASADATLIAQDLSSSCLKLIEWENRTHSIADGTSSKDGNDSKLVALANETIAIANDITNNLENTKSSGSKWATLRHSVLALWREAKIKDMVQRLKNLREELQFNVLVSMKAKVDILALRASMEPSPIDEQTKSLIAATLIDGVQTEDHNVWENNSVANPNLQNTENITGGLERLPLVVPEKIDPLRSILGSLYFHGINHRYEGIEQAHKSTFEWVFSGTQKQEASSSTLLEWMKGENGVYWVSGKAGSGKSTLMKYMAGDSRTYDAFKEWTAGRKLITASYWFWDLGTYTLQKSLEGLYRTLLYTIIRKEPAFASLLFPEQFEYYFRGGFPSKEDLQGAFKRLVSLQSPPACVGIFLDGLDEFATLQSSQLKLATVDEQLNLATLIKDAATSKHLKIVVASRPEKAFEMAFRNCDKLRLHELTYHDQELYTTDSLLDHPRMEYLLSRHNGQLTKDMLVQSIVKKSEGVFLWLRLVIVSMQLTLDECDDISDLGSTLDKLPRGLDRLFDDILHRIHINHQDRGFEYIKVVQLARLIAHQDPKQPQVPNVPPITALALSAVHKELPEVLGQGINQVLPAEAKDIVSKVDSRLKTTYGLVELKYHDRVRRENDPEIIFIHRTAAEYLYLSSKFRDLGHVDDIAIAMSLIKGYFTMISHYSISIFQFPHRKFCGWLYIDRVLRLCRIFESLDLTHVTMVIDALEKLLTRAQMTIYKPTTPYHWGEIFWTRWCKDDTLRPTRNQLLTFIANYGLKDYFHAKLQKLDRATILDSGFEMLHAACRPRRSSKRNGPFLHPPIIAELLELGVNPNVKGVTWDDEATTPWKAVLQTVCGLNIVNSAGARQLAKVLGLFIDKGADPAAEVCMEPNGLATWNYPNGNWRTTIMVIQWTFVDRFKPDTANPRFTYREDAYSHRRADFIPFKQLDGNIWSYFVDEAPKEDFPTDFERENIAALGQVLMQKLESRLMLAQQRRWREKVSRLSRKVWKR